MVLEKYNGKHWSIAGVLQVETSLTRANTQVNNSMVRLSTGKQQANAGDNSSYVAMGATFKVDYAGTKAGMKNIAVVQGFIDTAVAVLDQATNLNAKLMELAILANNSTNTSADLANIQAEYNAMTAEVTAILASTYKGASLFQSGMSVGIDGRTTTKSCSVAYSKCNDTNFICKCLRHFWSCHSSSGNQHC